MAADTDKTQLSQSLARGKTPIAKLVPYAPAVVRRCFGAMKGQMRVDAAFFEPLSEEELTSWGA